jgi:copper chaperone CopZ
MGELFNKTTNLKKMNTKILSLIVLLVLGTSTVFAKSKTEKIKVNGNCDMCKARIEKAAKSLDGVNSVDWDSETKIMEVSYNDAKATTEQIQTSVASGLTDRGSAIAMLEIIYGFTKEEAIKMLGTVTEGTIESTTETTTVETAVAPEVVVNDNIKNLTGRQLQAIMRIVRKYHKGELTENIAVDMLVSGYGMSQEQALIYLETKSE